VCQGVSIMTIRVVKRPDACSAEHMQGAGRTGVTGLLRVARVEGLMPVAAMNNTS
jgi:hypothetical protein